MQQRKCAQRGCVFESADVPELCPVCGNPFLPVVELPAAAADVDPPEVTLEQRLDVALARVLELELAVAAQRERIAQLLERATDRDDQLVELTSRVLQLERATRSSVGVVLDETGGQGTLGPEANGAGAAG